MGGIFLMPSCFMDVSRVRRKSRWCAYLTYRERIMKLLLRRSQKDGMMGIGKVTFILDVRADLTDEEKGHIKKYKLGDTMLYERDKIIDPGRGLLGLASRMAFKMMNISVSVDNLTKGKQIECKDVVEMLAVEEQIKEACETFKAVLTAAASFGGEEIIQY
jgi:hypothetical protein